MAIKKRRGHHHEYGPHESVKDSHVDTHRGFRRTTSPLIWTLYVFALFMICCPILVCSLNNNNRKQIPKVDLKFTSTSPAVLFAQTGESIILNCSGIILTSSSHSINESVPQTKSTVNTSWRFEEEDIPLNDSRRITRHDGSLTIKNFRRRSRKSYSRAGNQRKLQSLDNTLTQDSRSYELKKYDEGRYFCLIKNPSTGRSLLSPPTDVIFANRIPTLKVEVDEIQVKEGSNTRLQCQIIPSSQTALVSDIKWFLNIQPLHSKTGRFNIFGRVIQIINITLEDRGSYSCQGDFRARSGKIEVIKSESIKFNVLNKAENFENEEESDQLAFLGPSQVLIRDVSRESAHLECLTKFPTNTHNVRWTRFPEKEISNHSSIDSTGNLHITDLSNDDEGDYLCSINASSKDRLVRLSVLQRPILLKQPQDSLHPAAQTARMECPFSGTPHPVVSFYKDSQPLSSSGRITIRPGLLLISQTRSSDTGNYQCFAENEAGIERAAARITILTSEEVPPPPTGLVATNISSTSAIISWTAPIPRSPKTPVILYTLHTTPGVADQDLMTSGTSFLVEKLQPFTNYTFYVRAYNSPGASEPSEELTFQTDEDIPVMGPYFALTAISSSRLLITWKPLPVSLARGIITEYEIHYRRVAQENYLVSEVKDGSVLQHTLEDLIPGMTYQFRMLAGTSKGFPVAAPDDTRFPWVTYPMPSTDQVMTTTSQMMSITDKSSVKMETSDLMEDEGPESHQETQHEISKASSTNVWIYLFLFIAFILVACVILIVVIARRSDRSVRTQVPLGQVPSLLLDSIPSDVTAEDREMESFLDDGIRHNCVSNSALSSSKNNATKSSNGNNRCRLNGNSVDE